MIASMLHGAAEPAAARQTPPVALAAALASEDRAALAADVETFGDAIRGSTIFHTRHLTCVQCHSLGPGRSALGPDLAAMPAGVNRRQLVAHLVESILEPSSVIRPEHRAVTIVTEKGRTITGIIARETAAEVVVRDIATGGAETVISTSSIDECIPSTSSLMPGGLANLLRDRGQFLDLVRYLAEVAVGGPDRAATLSPDPATLATAGVTAYESDVDHVALLSDWSDPARSRSALANGERIYERVCANCHGTRDAPGSLPTAPRFASAALKHGYDPYAMYRTLTHGNGMMAAQPWMVPAQKYDVIFYIRETFLKDRGADHHPPVTSEYLAALPVGNTRGPAPSWEEPWRMHDYGPFLAGSFGVGTGDDNVARKGLALRLDPGAGGIGRGHAWLLWELDTLRCAAFWTGDEFIDWAGINFDGRHGLHPRIAGTPQVTLPTSPGWADPETGSFEDRRPVGRDGRPYGPLPRDHARVRALHHVPASALAGTRPGSTVVLDTLVGTTPVLETASLGPPLNADGATTPVVLRSFSFGPRTRPLTARLAAAPAAAAVIGTESTIAGHARAHVAVTDRFVDLHVPAGRDPLDVTVAIAQTGADALARHVGDMVLPAPPRTLIGRPAPPLWPNVVATAIAPGADCGPFAVDTFVAPDDNPWRARMRFSGVEFTGPDEALLCTWDGDVWSVRGIAAATGRLTWQRIASGLFQPLGIKRVGKRIHVACRDRILTLVDLDGDGLTDRYETFNDDHQVTEHFHEFAMGLEADTDGNLYYAKSGRHALPAVVPHHGTLLKVSADGSSTEIVATGFRAANGVCVETDGTFWVTDQEGHWTPKNRVNHVRPGGFYGNMLGYHDVSDADDSAMEPPAFWVTNTFDRSPAELLRVTGDSWRPLAGELLELSYGEGRVHLVLTESVADRSGVMQGGMVALPMPDLPTGVMRGRFSPADGQLYACGLFAWAGNRTTAGGFFRIRRTSQPLRIPVKLHAAPGRIHLSFTAPLDAAAARDVTAWQVRTWALQRSEMYGSDHVDERDLVVDDVEITADGRQVTLHVADFTANWCYSIAWAVRGVDGAAVRGLLNGTLH